MSTYVVIFSQEPDTLRDIQQRLTKMGLDPKWISVKEWYRNRDLIFKARAVILDEVDPMFSWSSEVDDLEQALLEATSAPPCLFLVSSSDRHLDGFARSARGVCVHYYNEDFNDDELYALLHSRNHSHADDIFALA